MGFPAVIIPSDCWTVIIPKLINHQASFIGEISTSNSPYFNGVSPCETSMSHDKLVGGFNTSDKYEFANWDDDIPNWMESHKSHVPVTNQINKPTKKTGEKRAQPSASGASSRGVWVLLSISLDLDGLRVESATVENTKIWDTQKIQEFGENSERIGCIMMFDSKWRRKLHYGINICTVVHIDHPTAIQAFEMRHAYLPSMGVRRHPWTVTGMVYGIGFTTVDGSIYQLNPCGSNSGSYNPSHVRWHYESTIPEPIDQQKC